MNKLVKYGKEVKEGDQVVVYKKAGKRLSDPVVVTVNTIRDEFFSTNYQFGESVFSNLVGVDSERDVWRPLVRKGDKLHVFKFEKETLDEPEVVTVVEDETEENALIFIEEHVLSDTMSNVLDVRDTDMDEWYFYSEEAEDYPVEWYEDTLTDSQYEESPKEERTSWVANEGDEEEYTPMSYADFNAAHGGGKTLKDYTGVDITEDSLAFESAIEKTLKGITPESLAFEESVDTSKDDMVEHPPHYNKYEREVIDSIRGLCTPDEFRGYLKGNIIKYSARYSDKDGIRDIDKLAQYTQFLREFEVEMEGE